jgi:probable addiction module antidote protein
MPKRTTDFREDLLADLADPQEAVHYLNAALEDSERMALVALRDVAEARQMARVAEEAGVAREALYRMLSRSGNPTFDSFMGILSALGLKILFAPTSPTDDSTRAHINLAQTFASGAGNGSFGPASDSRGVLQEVLEGDEMKGALGSIPRRPPITERLIRVGSAATCGGLLGATP